MMRFEDIKENELYVINLKEDDVIYFVIDKTGADDMEVFQVSNGRFSTNVVDAIDFRQGSEDDEVFNLPRNYYFRFSEEARGKLENIPIEDMTELIRGTFKEYESRT
jgi:hypothetical protein